MQKKIIIGILLLLMLLGVTYFNNPPSPVGGLTKEQIDAQLAIEEEIYAHVNTDGIVDDVRVVKWDYLIAHPERYGSSTEWIRTSTKNTIKKNYAGVGDIYDKSLDAFVKPKKASTANFDSVNARWDEPAANGQPKQPQK